MLGRFKELREIIADNSDKLSLIGATPADFVGELMRFDVLDADVDLWVSLEITIPPNLFQGVVTDLEGIIVDGIDDAINWFGSALTKLVADVQDLNLLTIGYNVTWNPGGGGINPK